MFSMFGFFRLALGILITGLCCGVVLAGNQSKNVGPYVTHFAKTSMQSLRFLHPMIFVTDFWFRYSFQENFTLLFLYLSSIKNFNTKCYVVLHLLFSYFSLNYGGILSWIPLPGVVSSKLSSLLSSPLKWKACSQSWASITFVMFVYRPEENPKNTLIAAFLANAISLFVHAPLKGGCIILSCSLRCFDTVFRRPCQDFSSS